MTTVPYIGGAVYRKASRGSGMAALVGGILLGSELFLLAGYLPPALGHPQWRPFWVFGFSWAVFFAWSVVENRLRGCIPETELASVLNRSDLGRPAPPEEVEQMLGSLPIALWEGRENVDPSAVGIPKRTPWYAHPTTFELAVVALLVALMVRWW